MKYPKRSQYKYAKNPYRIRNWADYEAGLQRRGDVTIWFSDEAIRSWKAAASGRPGGQRVYADVAIEASLMVRMVFHLPLRQTEGFLRSLATMLDLNIAIPDHTTLSRRSQGLAKLPLCPSTGKRPIHILVDSTGLRIHVGKRAPVPKRRAWRNLHVAVDAETGEVVASDLTSRRAADPRHLPKLLERIDRPLASARADAAYDTEDVYETIHAAGGGSDVRILIPPTRRAQLRRRPSPALKERNGSIRLVRRLSRSCVSEGLGRDPGHAS